MTVAELLARLRATLDKWDVVPLGHVCEAWAP